MIATLFRVLWIVIVAVTVGAAWWSIHLFGRAIGPWAAALLGVLAVFAVHPFWIASNFVIARMRGDPVPGPLRITPWQAVKMFDAEVDASLRGVWFGAPLLARRPARQPTAGTSLQPLPVLFIHGYLGNRAMCLSFASDAAERGYVCEAITLPDPFAAIDSQLPAVDRAIDELLAKARAAGSTATRVALVGHSMGGLVARAAVVHLDASRIGPVITLGSPHHGTLAATVGVTPSVAQMQRGSAWLAQLSSKEATRSGRRSAMTTVFSLHDQIVYPQRTAALDGTTQVAIGGVGHVALLYDRRIRTIVFDALARSIADQPLQAASEGLSAS